MGQLKLYASRQGASPQAQAQSRGKLFETLMTQVLRQLGYKVDRIPSVNYAGMEIDIEGISIVTQIPLYAECKFYETPIDSPKLQAFVGKYTMMWRKDQRCQGLFVAIPGVNSHAKAFYIENLRGAKDMTVRLIEGDEVLDAIMKSSIVCPHDRLMTAVPGHLGTLGDWSLIYTDRGFFWIQLTIPPGSAIASQAAVFDSKGVWLSDEATLDYIRSLDPELSGYDILRPAEASLRTTPPLRDSEEIVEVRGSSSCFEYQFPAAPAFFVGRANILRDVDLFAKEILERTTSARGMLFEANSGLGKSSAALACVARLQSAGHFAVSIDCRSASSPQFILRVINHVMNRFNDFDGLVPRDTNLPLPGVQTACQQLIEVGQSLASAGRLLVVFFDQFENLFFLPETLRPIKDVFLRICDAQPNIVFGFSWKTDLFGLTTDFPFQMRDTIAGASRRMLLEPFSEPETTDMLNRLSDELHSRLRKDLVFFLSDFSQGYPWLLKKLCAHVKLQRDAGVAQKDIANSLLNVEQLFEEDLRGLSPEEHEALRRIAKASPISSAELGDDIRSDILQSLVNARLVIRVGTKIDVYWDIFRDYINSGQTPVSDNYILRIQVGAVLKATKVLVERGGGMSSSDFKEAVGLSEKSFYNILKEMRLLGIATIGQGMVRAGFPMPVEGDDLPSAMRGQLKEQLRRNRLVWKILEHLDVEPSESLDVVAEILSQSCPYVSATARTWRTYARVFGDWMDFADLAVLDAGKGRLSRRRPGSEVRHRTFVAGHRPLVMARMPTIQYRPVLEVCTRICGALEAKRPIDFAGLKRSTTAKALSTLDDLGLIERKPTAITVSRRLIELGNDPHRAAAMLGQDALKMDGFASFVEILKLQADSSWSLRQLGRELAKRLGYSWKDGTATTIAKILLDWARHTGMAPAQFSERRRGRRGPEGSAALGTLFDKQ